MTLQTGAVAFIERHGRQLPAVYSDFSSEYSAATTSVGIHDASYMGRLKAIGEDGLDLLNRMSTNKVDNLDVGEGAVTVLTTDRGRIVDVLGVANRGDCLVLLTSPGQQQPIIDWLDKYTIMEDLAIEDVTLKTSMLAIIGPGAGKLLGLTPNQLAQDALTTQLINLGGTDATAVEQPLGPLSRYWLIVETDYAPRLWQHLTRQGATPLGTNAMDAVRVNYAVPEYGPELGEPYNPLEAGLIGSVDFAKGCYIGQEVIARLDSYKKVKRYLVSIRFDTNVAVSAGDELVKDGQTVGTITSIAPGPSDGTLHGLGYVKAENAAPGTQLEVSGPEKALADIIAFAQPFGPAKG